MKIVHAIDVACSPEALWPWLTEPDRLKQWMKGLEAIEPEGSDIARVGARARLRIREGRRVSVYDEVITAYDPPRALAVDITGGPLKDRMTLRVRYALTRTGAGVHLDYECSADVTGIWRLLSAVFGLFARMQVRSFFRTLKRLAEAGDARTAGA